jgi:AcrR family transcriptional regulator
MNDKDNKILSAAYDSFIRYGVKRTTMGDVAQAAGVLSDE